MKRIITPWTRILIGLLLSTSVLAKPFDVWEVDPQGMAIFIWTQYGEPSLTQQHQSVLENSIEKDFSLAGKYYPTPAQLADFFLTWLAPGFPENKDELRSSIIAWESIEVTKSDLDKALAYDILDYVRRNADCPRCPSDFLRDGLIKVCHNPTENGPCHRACTPHCERREPEGGGASYIVVNSKELERRYYQQVTDRKRDRDRFERTIRKARFREQHPDMRDPGYLTSSYGVQGRPESYAITMGEAHIRAYDIDRDDVFAGVIMENIIQEIRSKSR